MKTVSRFVLTMLFLSVGAGSSSWAGGDSGPGNGTDYVKVLFAEARHLLNQNLADVHAAEIRSMQLEDDVRNWLLSPTENGSQRIEVVKAYLQILELKFQNEPCQDSQGRTSSICFFQEQGKNIVVVSLEQNRQTTSDQAMAMLIHESAHFTGEMNHLFLDKVGVQLVSQLTKNLIVVSRQSIELSPNIFVAKSLCESGESEQAHVLLKLARQDLQIRCAQRNISCDLSKASPAYTADPEWIVGVGFTLKLTCTVRLVLAL